MAKSTWPPRIHRSRSTRSCVAALAAASIVLAGCGFGGSSSKTSKSSTAGATTSTTTKVSVPKSTSFPTFPSSIEPTTPATSILASVAGGASGGGTARAAAGGYTVKAGDYWLKIAKDLGVTLQDLLDANGATAKTNIVPGQVLSIPAKSTATTVAGAPTATTPPSATVAQTTVPGATTVAGKGGTYTVKSGDYWIKIAKDLGVNLQDLLTANGATTSTLIVAGQKLNIPAKKA